MNCRPGDTARIVGADQFPANNGRLVRVLRTANPDDYGMPFDEHSWECDPLEPIWGDYDDGSVEFNMEYTAIPDDDLLVVRQDDPSLGAWWLLAGAAALWLCQL